MDSFDNLNNFNTRARAFYRQPLNWAGKTLTAERELRLELDEEDDADGVISLASSAITYTGDFDGVINLRSNIYDLGQSGLAYIYLYDVNNNKVVAYTVSTVNGSVAHSIPKSFRHSFSSSGLFILVAVATSTITVAFDLTTAALSFDAGIAVTGITQANPGVVSATAHGRSNGDVVYLSGVVGMTEVNDVRYEVSNANTNDFSLANTDTSGFTAYSSGGIVNSFPRMEPWSVEFLNLL